MEWRDEGVILAARRHGERDALVSVMTLEHGRHAGLVPAGGTRRSRAFLQIGNRVACEWRARLEEHLGNFKLDVLKAPAGAILDQREALAALSSACALIDAALAERDPHPRLFAMLVLLLETLQQRQPWGRHYVAFELLLLEELGFALRLDQCAVTGGTVDLAFVSPRTGRAVSRDAAGAFAARLLPRPPFFDSEREPLRGELADALRLTGHFLARHIFDALDRPVPYARERLESLYRSGEAA